MRPFDMNQTWWDYGDNTVYKRVYDRDGSIKETYRVCRGRLLTESEKREIEGLE